MILRNTNLSICQDCYIQLNSAWTRSKNFHCKFSTKDPWKVRSSISGKKWFVQLSWLNKPAKLKKSFFFSYARSHFSNIFHGKSASKTSWAGSSRIELNATFLVKEWTCGWSNLRCSERYKAVYIHEKSSKVESSEWAVIVVELQIGKVLLMCQLTGCHNQSVSLDCQEYHVFGLWNMSVMTHICTEKAVQRSLKKKWMWSENLSREKIKW